MPIMGWEFVRTGQNVLFCVIPKLHDSPQVYERSRVRERREGTGTGFIADFIDLFHRKHNTVMPTAIAA